LQSSVLWQDELALAVPTRSPLLAYATIPLQELRCYDLLQWCSSGSPELEQRITTCMPAPKRASSFELMATLVAAGYAVGIAPRSQILHGRSWGIIMRQFAHDSYSIHTHLHYLQNPTPAIERFATRATQLLSRIQKDAYGL
jgi:DNA-binding transcriptional LysR family regulator